jgi:hypothetical protein
MQLLALAATVLQITVWPQGTGEPSRAWTLRCAPPGGTLPQPGRACRTLAARPNPFAPVPRTSVCTATFGGPQVALVTGRYRDRRVFARFNRRDGCQIARWNRLRPLFPVSTDA